MAQPGVLPTAGDPTCGRIQCFLCIKNLPLKWEAPNKRNGVIQILPQCIDDLQAANPLYSSICGLFLVYTPVRDQYYGKRHISRCGGNGVFLPLITDQESLSPVGSNAEVYGAACALFSRPQLGKGMFALKFCVGKGNGDICCIFPRIEYSHIGAALC